ncbi:MAG: helix-turn-helix transcriptional regulator [Micromonosporaceae bacterium]
MSRNRTERLVNLVICLLSTRRFLTAAQIAHTVPGYEHNPANPREHDAFQRKFERDKAELRELGVPLQTGSASVFDTEPGYRITRPQYELPDVLLEPDEAAAVGIAGRLWQHAGLSSAASSGLLKLRAAGVEVDPQATLGIEPVVTVEPAFGPLTSAAAARQAVTFSYRPPEVDDAVPRRLQPWGVVCWRSRWYVVGHDLDREAPRCFRLSRIVGGVRRSGKPGAYQLPDGVNLIDYVARWSGPAGHQQRATLVLRPGKAAGVRRWADQVEPGEDGDRALLRYSDADRLADWLVGYGADVVVLDPPEVREAMIARLERAVSRFPAAVTDPEPDWPTDAPGDTRAARDGRAAGNMIHAQGRRAR